MIVLTVGHNDCHPSKRLSILVALVGIVFTGLVVAIALHAAQTS